MVQVKNKAAHLRSVLIEVAAPADLDIVAAYLLLLVKVTVDARVNSFRCVFLVGRCN